ncbi:transposase [Xenorhabdus sp. PB62.4]|nr:transposase [Xenorhabdus sp. PB62.4]
MAKVDVYCRYCHKSEEVKGHAKETYRYCYACCKVFQLEYTCRACKPEVKEQVVDMGMNNADICNTIRVLKVTTVTVMKILKNSAP